MGIIEDIVDRRCPYCNAKISYNAKKCWRCKEWLISKEEKEALDQEIKEEKEEEAKHNEQFATGLAFVIILVVIFFAIIGIANTFFGKTEKSSTTKDFIEQQGDIIEQNNETTEEKDVNGNPYQIDNERLVKEKEAQEERSMREYEQRIQQPVAPQPTTVQTQQSNQDVDDFMN